MLSIGGQGMLLNAIYPYWIVQVLSRGTVMAVLCEGVPSVVVFEISPSYMKTFHYAPRRTQPPPGPPVRLCDVSALALGKTRFVAITAYRCRVRFRRPRVLYKAFISIL